MPLCPSKTDRESFVNSTDPMSWLHWWLSAIPSCRPLKHLLQERHPRAAQAEGSTLPAQPLLSEALDQRGPGTTGRHQASAPQEQDDVLTQSCWAVVTQPTHSLSTNVTLEHFSNIPHPLTHPRLLHAEKSMYTRKTRKGKGAKAFLFVQAWGNIQAPNHSQKLCSYISTRNTIPVLLRNSYLSSPCPHRKTKSHMLCSPARFGSAAKKKNNNMGGAPAELSQTVCHPRLLPSSL